MKMSNVKFWRKVIWTKDESNRPERVLLTYVLAGALPLSLAVLVFGLITQVMQQLYQFVLFDLVMVGIITILYILNRQGWWKPALYGMLLVVLIGGTTDPEIFGIVSAFVIAVASLYNFSTSLIFTIAAIITNISVYGVPDIWFLLWHALIYVGISCLFYLMGRLNRKYFTQSTEAAEDRKRNLERLEALRGIERTISSTLDITEIMDIIMSNLKLIVPYDSITVQMFKNQTLAVLASRGLPESEQYIDQVVPLDETHPSKWVIDSKQSLALEDITKDYPQFKTISSGRIRSWLGTPLLIQEKVTGLITLDRFEIKPFTEVEIQTVQSFGSWVAIVLENARLFNKTQTRFNQLRTLRSIDKAISNVLDSDMMLRILINHIIAQLKVDAACILIYDPQQEVLEYHAGHGFKTKLFQQASLRLGEGLAGQAAHERHLIQYNNLDDQDTGLLFSEAISKEGFTAYFGVPLIAKGRLMGVLEIYQRDAFYPDQDWLDFFESLGGQVAIAIESTDMFSGLLRANQELDLAYDQTLEGWARALEFHDMETQGHSQRVTNRTMLLARDCGIKGKALDDVHRGALLHDIGKMAVPDHIIQKPGPLNAQEWEIIRQHPRFAYDMLKDIDYLHLALDIPLHHHEKWDGTGYPAGLSGDQIPLAARVFAIIDVYDALTNDRPYRDAWTKEKALQYIQEQSGKHFDPAVVEKFFDLIAREDTHA